MEGRHLGGGAARAVLGLALAAAAVTASITASTGLAAAGDDPWPDTVGCATGAFTGHVVREADISGPYLELSGWAQPCPGEKNGEPGAARFGFAYMRAAFSPRHTPGAEGLMHNERLRVYEHADAPTPWSGRFDLWGTGTFRTEAPLCLMQDPATKLACVRVEMQGSGPDAKFTVSPLPLDDPRVANHTIVFVTGNGTNPECGACV
jgi:hypothetical protein